MPPQSIRINRKLNLIVPIDDTSRGTMWAHVTPISLEIFEHHFEVIAGAHARMFRQGGSGIGTAVRVAAMHVKRVADDLGVREEVDRGLFPEIERLTNVAVLEDGKGWVIHPYHEARNWLDPDDRSLLENAIAFFIVNSAVMPRTSLPSMLGLMESLWGAQTTSSDCTAFVASLGTSMPAATTEERVG